MNRLTACSRDCPDTCGLEAEVVAGKLVALKGVKNDSLTQGFLCPRTTRFVDRQYSVERLRTPLRRDGENWAPVSWEEALDLAAEKLLETREKYGAETILHYQSGGSLGYLKNLNGVFFEQFGPVTIKRGDICAGAGEWAQEADFGLCDSSDTSDLLNSRLIVIWGKNVHTSSVHLVPLLMEAKRAGCKIVSINPMATRSTRLADLSLCPRPGTDGQLALAVVSHLIEQQAIDPEAASYCENLEEFLAAATAVSFQERMERCGLDPAEGRQFAELYRLHSPSSILVGWGAPRRPNGADTVRAMDALAAVSGNIGKPGACVSYYFQRRRHFSSRHLPPPVEPPRTFSEPCLGQEMRKAEPRIRLAWITAGNPAAMLPDSQTVAEELLKVDFMVVVGTHHSDTTALADLVLPTLTMVEDDDVMGAYGNHQLRVSRPVVEPEGEARHELWIFQELARRVGLEGLLDGTPREWKDRLLAPEVDRAVLEGGATRQPGAPFVLFEGRNFPTPSGKVRLMTHEPPLPRELENTYPFRLMAISHPDSQCSQWSVEPPSRPTARISQEAPEEWEHGSVVRLESRRGGFEVILERVSGMHPELIVLPKGGSAMFGGWCPNDLIQARETDFGVGASFYDEPVRLVH